MENHKNQKHNNNLIIPDDMSIDISTDNIFNYSDIATSDSDHLTEELSSILGCFTSNNIKNGESIADSDTNIDSDFMLKSNNLYNKKINNMQKTVAGLCGGSEHTSHRCPQPLKESFMGDNEAGASLSHSRNSISRPIGDPHPNVSLENQILTTSQTKISNDMNIQLEQTKNNMLELKIDIYQILQLVNGLKEKIVILENDINILKTLPSNSTNANFPSDDILEKISKLQLIVETNEKNYNANNADFNEKIKNIANNISNEIIDNKIENIKKYIDDKISVLQLRFSNTKKFIMNKK